MNATSEKIENLFSQLQKALRSPWCYFVFLTVLTATIPLSIVIYVYYFRPSLLQEGVGVAGLSVFALMLARFGYVRKLIAQYGARQIFEVTYRFRAILAAMLILILVSQMVWFVNKIEALRDRYEYVSLVKKSLSIGRNDELIPNLAKAFFLYPSRPEVQVLFTRLSRSLLFARESRYFRAYQKSFLSELNKLHAEESVENFESRIGSEHKGRLDYDPLIFYMYTILESGANFLSDGTNPGQGVVSAVEKYHELKSSSNTILAQPHRAIHIFKINSSISQYHLLNYPEYQNFNVAHEIEKIEGDIGKLPESDLAELISSHHYQEFLDQVLFMHVTKALEHFKAFGPFLPNDSDRSAKYREEIRDAIRVYAEILRLRLYFSVQDSVFWVRQPTKLNAFHFFAQLERLGVQSDSKIYDEALSEGDLAAKLKELLAQPTFEVFQKEREWYRGSPLTFELDNSQFSQAILRMLDSGWD